MNKSIVLGEQQAGTKGGAKAETAVFTLSCSLRPGRRLPDFHVTGTGNLQILAAQCGLVWDSTQLAYRCPTAYHARMVWCYADPGAHMALSKLFPKLTKPVRPTHLPYLIAANDRLICLATPENSRRAQAQGFRCDSGAHYWWTQDLRRALPLIDLAEPELARRLAAISELPLEGLGDVEIGDLLRLDPPEGAGASSGTGNEEEGGGGEALPSVEYDQERGVWTCSHPVARASGFHPSGGTFVTNDFEQAARLRPFATLTAELRFQAEALIRTVPSPIIPVNTTTPIPLPATAPAPLGQEQIACVHFSRSRTGAIIADEMGVGKTAEAIGIINASTIRRCLVVVPAHLQENWMEECGRWLLPQYRAAIVRTDAQGALQSAEVIIVSYDSLPGLVEALGSLEWDILFVDEGHRLKNRDTRAGRIVYQVLRPLSAAFYDLTGTPIWNRPQDLFAPLHAIAPEVFPDETMFRRLYAVSDARNINDVQRQRLDFLAHMLKSGLMIRRLTADVLRLPPKKHFMMDMSGIPQHHLDALRERDEELRSAVIAEIARTVGDDVAEAIQYAGTAAASTVLGAAVPPTKRTKSVLSAIAQLRYDVGLVKLPQVRDSVLGKWRSTGIPPLIFGKHRELLRLFAEDLRSAGMRIELLTGAVSTKRRHEGVTKFQAGEVDGAVAGYDAAGVGYTLTRTNWLTVFELDFNPPLIDQAIARVHRRGQTRDVSVDWAAIPGTIDSHIAGLYLDKGGIARAALGDHLIGMFEPHDIMHHPIFTDPANDEGGLALDAA